MGQASWRQNGWAGRPYGYRPADGLWKRAAPLILPLLAVLLLAGGAQAQAPGPITSPTPSLASRTIVAFGDSLTAGYGLPPAEGFTVKLEQALKAAGTPARVINAGLSGDTSMGGKSRLAWSLAEKPDLVILELGGNDALRAIDPAITRANLDAILTSLRERGIPVLLAGMLAPPNFGSTYGNAFNAIFPDLAKKHGVPLYPFFLEGVAAKAEFNQPDGIHPNAAGVDLIVKQIAPVVAQLLKSS